MNTAIEDIKNRFKDAILQVNMKNDRRATLTVGRENIVDIAAVLCQELNWRFIIATALESRDGIEILYHFGFDRLGIILNIRVILEREKPEIESLTGLFEASGWIEREMHEIMGINFLHHPNLDKLISDGNWAEGVYPYRNER
jgi:NADH-quinone oxidoreductase subunit C